MFMCKSHLTRHFVNNGQYINMYDIILDNTIWPGKNLPIYNTIT